MPDLRLSLTADGSDLELENGDLAREDGLVSAVLVSLFSDGRASDDVELPDGGADLRGWWAERRGEGWGSLLWLHSDRGKATEETAGAVRQAAQDALEWLTLEGIADKVEVFAQVSGRLGTIDLEIQVYRSTARAWDAVWTATATSELVLEGVTVKLLAP